jgi:hypothetical protein
MGAISIADDSAQCDRGGAGEVVLSAAPAPEFPAIRAKLKVCEALRIAHRQLAEPTGDDTAALIDISTALEAALEYLERSQ